MFSKLKIKTHVYTFKRIKSEPFKYNIYNHYNNLSFLINYELEKRIYFSLKLKLQVPKYMYS